MVLWPMLDIPIEAFFAVRAITWISSELADSKIPVFLSTLEAKVKAYSNKGGYVRAHGFSMPSVPLFHTSSSSAGGITTACCWSAPMPSFQSETQTMSSVFRRSRNRRSDLSNSRKDSLLSCISLSDRLTSDCGRWVSFAIPFLRLLHKDIATCRLSQHLGKTKGPLGLSHHCYCFSSPSSCVDCRVPTHMKASYLAE